MQAASEAVEWEGDPDGGEAGLAGPRGSGRQGGATDGHSSRRTGGAQSLQLLHAGRRWAGGPGRRGHRTHPLGEEGLRGEFKIFFKKLSLSNIIYILRSLNDFVIISRFTNLVFISCKLFQGWCRRYSQLPIIQNDHWLDKIQEIRKSQLKHRVPR